jgi:hypothetical protein
LGLLESIEYPHLEFSRYYAAGLAISVKVGFLYPFSSRGNSPKVPVFEAESGGARKEGQSVTALPLGHPPTRRSGCSQAAPCPPDGKKDKRILEMKLIYRTRCEEKLKQQNNST